jgi:hypothetical protein
MSFFAMPLLCEDVIVRDIFRCKGRLICTVQRCYQGECLDSFTVEKIVKREVFLQRKTKPDGSLSTLPEGTGRLHLF